MSNEIIKRRRIKKKLIIWLVIFAIYLGIMIYLYFFLIHLGTHPFITTLLFIFILLVTISPFLRKNKRSLYARMFPNRKRKSTSEYQKKSITTQYEEEMRQVQPKIPRSVNLDFRYRKPIINKCENCGNIIPNFVKKCPFCNVQVKY